MGGKIIRSDPYSSLVEGMYVLAGGALMSSADRPVKLVRRIVTPLGQSGQWWDVECLTHDYIYQSSERALGEELNEMEVLAWAVRH